MTLSLTGNRLLAALLPPELARLSPQFSEVLLDHKGLVYSAGGDIDFVYFPFGGVVSAVIAMDDGATAETAAIGREGMLGASTALGATQSVERVFCQVSPSTCKKLPVADFLNEYRRQKSLFQVVNRYLLASMTVSAHQTACNALHVVEERCARWLLMCHDRAGSDEFALTHEFLATMLGVRRATVTTIARSLSNSGMIGYRHGRVRVLDREQLEESACECYLSIRKAFDFPPS